MHSLRQVLADTRVLDGPTTLEIIDESNNDISDACVKAGRGFLDKLIVWGGNIGNGVGDAFLLLSFNSASRCAL